MLGHARADATRADYPDYWQAYRRIVFDCPGAFQVRVKPVALSSYWSFKTLECNMILRQNWLRPRGEGKKPLARLATLLQALGLHLHVAARPLAIQQADERRERAAPTERERDAGAIAPGGLHAMASDGAHAGHAGLPREVVLRLEGGHRPDRDRQARLAETRLAPDIEWHLGQQRH